MTKIKPRRAGVRTGVRAHEIRDAALVILDRSNTHRIVPSSASYSRAFRSAQVGIWRFPRATG
jgi:hypothetical protein